jgi:transposase
MIERSGELPDDVDELRALTLANAARANQFEADAQVARGEVLKLKAEVNDLAEANATAKAEIARLTSILKTLRRGRFGKKSEKLGSVARRGVQPMQLAGDSIAGLVKMATCA